MAHFSTVTLRLMERYATALILDVAFDESSHVYKTGIRLA